MALYLNILSVVLLALVAGLLLALFFQLKVWRAANREAPLLAEKMAEAMLSARKGLADLKHELIGQGPELNRLLTEGDKLRVELQFLIQRGAQMADRLDTSEQDRKSSDVEDEMPMMRLSAAAQAVVSRPAGLAEYRSGAQDVVERVAVANGLAAKPVGNGDPLEELLANLQAEPEPEKKIGKRKRVGPVTQAELDLQQSLKRGAA